MVEVKNLTYCYPGSATASLQDIKLHVRHGQLFGLLGPNGAGKSTLLSLLSGLLNCGPGCIYLNGKDRSRIPMRERVSMSLVPQEYAFYGQLSVLENLRFFARMQRLQAPHIAQCVERAAAVTSIEHVLGKPAALLSGGMKRRLNLAIGLLNQPQVLLLDEPTVGIDPHSRHFILETIRDLSKSGTTVIYTSHYMEEVETLCDEIAIIDHGRLLVQGELAQLLDTSASRRLTIEFANPVAPQQLTALGLDTEILSSPHTLELEVHHVRDIIELLPRLTDLSICGIHYGQNNLEQLFLQLTHHDLRD